MSGDLTNLSIQLTTACNLGCHYCPLPVNHTRLPEEAIESFLAHFFPRLRPGCSIGFTGGEPLLAFPLIERAVRLVSRLDPANAKRVKYQITTNGTLLTPVIWRFFERQRFDLLLSFDGLAQDITRPGSRGQVAQVVQKLPRYPGIQSQVNLVVTPDTAYLLSASVRQILDLGAPGLRVTTERTVPWGASALAALAAEFDAVSAWCNGSGGGNGRGAIANLGKPGRAGIFACFAARDRLALAADGTVWGCYMFPWSHVADTENRDFSDYRLGPLDQVLADYRSCHRRVFPHYAELRQDLFHSRATPCFLCRDFKRCRTCPLTATLASGELGLVPDWFCALNRLERKWQRTHRRRTKIALRTG